MEELPKPKSKRRKIFFTVLLVGILIFAIYTVWYNYRPEVSSHWNTTNSTINQSDNNTITYNNTEILRWQAAGNATIRKVIPEGRWLRVQFSFTEPANLHIYNENNDSITEVQTGDKYFTDWDRKFWTRNGNQEYTIEIRFQNESAIGELLITQIGRLESI